MFDKLPKSKLITIEFDDLSYTVPAPRQRGKVEKDRLTILDGVTGVFRPGQLTAIMGPSGSGKSTLLNVLAGYKVRGVKGNISINGTARNLQKFRKIQAYIMQDDFLLPYLSVEEAMTAAANLKLGRGFSHQDRRQVVDDVLETLGLSSCRNTRCLTLSGGQRKRLSIALELVNNPPVMFFDEPTSGLDSNSCSSCLSLLKSLAAGGRTIICTIHQPSSRLFQQFDQLYILAGGSCVYRGSRPNLVPALAEAGLQCPEFHNPADFVMEAASGEYGSWTDRLVSASQNGRSLAWEDSDQNTAPDGHCHTVDETDRAIPKINIEPNGHIIASPKNTAHRHEKSEVQANGQIPAEKNVHCLPNGGLSHNSKLPSYKEITGPQLNGAPLLSNSAPGLSTDAEGGEPGCTSLLLEQKSAAPVIGLCQRLDANAGGRLGPAGAGDGGEICQKLDSGRELYRTSSLTQFRVLLKRTCQSIVRDRMLTLARLISHILFGVLIGILYYDIGNEAKDVYNNTGQLFFTLMFVLFSALMPTILTFPCEMAVFKKEYLNCWYSMKSYYIAKTLADIPFQIVFPLIYDAIVYFMTSQPMEADRFLKFCIITVLTSLVAQSTGLVIGACCGVQLAVFLGPVAMIPIVLFSGFFITLNAIPVYLRWLASLSYARYCFEGLLLAIYGSGREDMRCSQPYCHFRSADKFLKEMGMVDSDFWVDAAILGGMILGLRLLGYFVLRWKLRMES